MRMLGLTISFNLNSSSMLSEYTIWLLIFKIYMPLDLLILIIQLSC